MSLFNVLLHSNHVYSVMIQLEDSTARQLFSGYPGQGAKIRSTGPRFKFMGYFWEQRMRIFR